MISQADVAETSLVNNEDIEKHKFSKLIKKAIYEDKLILEEIDGKEWIFNKHEKLWVGCSRNTFFRLLPN